MEEAQPIPAMARMPKGPAATKGMSARASFTGDVRSARTAAHANTATGASRPNASAMADDAGPTAANAAAVASSRAAHMSAAHTAAMAARYSW